MQETALAKIHRALEENGFKRDWVDCDKRTWRGALNCSGRQIRVRITVPDLDFVHFPIISIQDNSAFPIAAAHVFRGGNVVCYLDQNQTVLDRYDPAGTVLRCLKNAEKTLNDALKGTSIADFEQEFFIYWGDKHAFIDLPHSYKNKTASIHWIKVEGQTRAPYISATDTIPETFRRLNRRLAGTAAIDKEECWIIPVSAPLRPNTSLAEWPPTNLAVLTAWLAPYGVDLQQELNSIIPASTGNDWRLLLRAPNGDFIATVELPTIYQKEEFTKNRRNNLAKILFEDAGAVKIQRAWARPVNAEYVYGRNTHGMANLANKKILLIGCGTIGSFLAQQLAQCGAGSGEGGALDLVDPGTLTASNLGRHLLGVPYLLQNKASACRDFLMDSLPHLTVRAHSISALDLKHRFATYDLLIDATGEEALSIAINDIAVSARPNFPPVMYAWLEGDGAIGQALLTGDDAYACYKCLKPDLHGLPRFNALKSETTFITGAACGDLTYVPFPVSRSVQTASLALELCLAWAKSDVRHRHQSRTFDRDKANIIKDGNPPPSDRCPSMSEALTVTTSQADTMAYLPSSVLCKIRHYSRGDESALEAGGIFIGAYRGAHIEVVDCTYPLPGDVRARHFFDRKDPGHQVAALRAWNESACTLTYVGEWHTHPERNPTPSGQDFRTWNGVIHKQGARPALFFIQGTVGACSFIGVNCTLFRGTELAEGLH